MISTAGLPASLSLKLIERERAVFETSIEKNALNKREIDAFRERIGSVQTVEDLVGDYELYSFVMKAFDLEDQIFGKALMKKMWSSDGTDKKSLINKLTDARFKEAFKTLGFTDGGTKNPNTTNQNWVESMVDRYVDQKLITAQLADNEIVGNVLHAQAKMANVTSWYTVLADTKLQDFFYTALGFPDEMKSTDLDAQVTTLKKKFDLETIQDPEVFAQMQRRYIAIGEARAAQTSISDNPILQLFSNSSTQQAITSINLDGLSLLRQGRY